MNFLQNNEFSSGFYTFLFTEESFKLGSHLALNSDKERFFVSDGFSPDKNVFRNFSSLFIIHYRSFFSDELSLISKKFVFGDGNSSLIPLF